MSQFEPVLIRLFAAGEVLNGVYRFVYVAAPLNLLDVDTNPKPAGARLQQASAVLGAVHPHLHHGLGYAAFAAVEGQHGPCCDYRPRWVIHLLPRLHLREKGDILPEPVSV